MQGRLFAVAVFLLSYFALGGNTGVSATMQSIAGQQAAQEHEFLARREHFASGRELLLTKRVPFDPDELLRDGWAERLKPTLDAMPEMHQARYETAPLQGLYLADTLYLPEKVQITGHTVILNGATASPGPGAFISPGTTPTCSPIIVDTRGEGFPLTSAVSGVMFDITGTGQPVQLGWTERGSHNAFLALPGSDGLVHNGKQLFGNFTPQPESAHPNGFLALAEFDKPENGGDGNGVIDDDDAVFSTATLVD
jgi:hypothetical protein